MALEADGYLIFPFVFATLKYFLALNSWKPLLRGGFHFSASLNL